jgi:DNA polymerase elongation subunit (family B)
MKTKKMIETLRGKGHKVYTKKQLNKYNQKEIKFMSNSGYFILGFVIAAIFTLLACNI